MFEGFRLVEREGVWLVEHNNKPVSLGGVITSPLRAFLVEHLRARSISVDDEGYFHRLLPDAPTAAPEPEDVPAEKLAVPEPPEAAQEPAGVLEQKLTKTQVADILQKGYEASRDKMLKDIVSEEAPVAEEPVLVVRKVGRPRVYSEEEIKDRRREQNREYYRKRKETKPEAVKASAQRWREGNPDKTREYRERANERRRERYHSDPEYRARVQNSIRVYKERKQGAQRDT